jgi:outer membrane protein, heavy metal efflux system
MMKTLNLLLILLCASLDATSQVVDSVLKSIERNNKSIQSNAKLLDAQRAEFRTALTPYDPQVEYDYLFGFPGGSGNQREFSVTQRLDFPTVYKKKRALSNAQIDQTGIQEKVFRQDILLEAKLTVLDLIYLNKKAVELQRRMSGTEQLVLDYQKKLEKGDVIILDVNKARLQLLNIQNDVRLNENERRIVTTRLTALNGGVEIAVTDTSYPALPQIPSFEILDSLIEANDPVIQVYEQDKIIRQQQLDVQKAMNLPKIEAGYHSQGLLGQSYRGLHAGISIPLWENKNRLRAAQSRLDYAVANAETHRLTHRLENRGLYEQLEVRERAMREYYGLMTSLNNTELLDKSLRLGQITVIQYFTDQSYYYSAYDRYLQLELEYQKAVAELFKFQL